MINQTTISTEKEEGITQSYKDLENSTIEADNYIEESLQKFQDLDSFFQKANDQVDYYFSIQKKYREKEEFVLYLKGLLQIYVSYLSGLYENPDEEIDEEMENIIEFIEENYDFLIYFGEDVNPIYKRFNNPNSNSKRQKLRKTTENRLFKLLSE